MIHEEAGNKICKAKAKIELVVTKNRKRKVYSSYEAEERRSVPESSGFIQIISINHYLFFFTL